MLAQGPQPVGGVVAGGAGAHNGGVAAVYPGAAAVGFKALGLWHGHRSLLYQALDVEAAVHVDVVAGGVGEFVAAQGTYHPGYVLGGAPPGNGEGPLLDQAVIFALYGAGHVGGNDAGAYLVHQNALPGQAVGVQGWSA